MTKIDAIRGVLRASPVPLSMREIHARLADDGVEITRNMVGSLLWLKTSCGEFVRTGRVRRYAWAINPDYAAAPSRPARKPVMTDAPILRQQDVLAVLRRERVTLSLAELRAALNVDVEHSNRVSMALVHLRERGFAQRVGAGWRAIETSDMRQRAIAEWLRGRGEHSATVIAHAVEMALRVVHTELARMVRAGSAQRVHSPDGILRYRAVRGDPATRSAPIYNTRSGLGRGSGLRRGEARDRVLEALRASAEPLTRAQLASAARVDRATVGCVLKRLRAAGLVRSMGRANRAVNYLVGSRADPLSPAPASPTAPARHSGRDSDAVAGAAPESCSTMAGGAQ